MSAPATVVHVARQPILDGRKQIYGYELLHRASENDTTCEGVSEGSARMLGDALLAVGLETLTDGHWAFVNIDEGALIADACAVLPPDQVVLEILETVPMTPRVIDTVRDLTERGYTVALDDFVPGSPAEALIPYARFMKLDVLALDPLTVKQTAARALQHGISVIAEKVETEQAFTQARAAGCSLFQGYHFCRPTSFSGRALPPSHVAGMQLMAALNEPGVSLATVEDLLKRDVSLSYRVLRTVNSAGFGLRREVTTMREALLMLGLEQVRRWASIWAVAGLSAGPNEVVTMAIVRARTCEVLGQDLRHGSSCFLLGLCSLLDALVGHPLAEILRELPLQAEIKAALLGEQNTPRRVLDAVIHHERGEWPQADHLMSTLGLPREVLPEAYEGALAWSRMLTRETKRS